MRVAEPPGHCKRVFSPGFTSSFQGIREQSTPFCTMQVETETTRRARIRKSGISWTAVGIYRTYEVTALALVRGSGE